MSRCSGWKAAKPKKTIELNLYASICLAISHADLAPQLGRHKGPQSAHLYNAMHKMMKRMVFENAHRLFSSMFRQRLNRQLEVNIQGSHIRHNLRRLKLQLLGIFING